MEMDHITKLLEQAKKLALVSAEQVRTTNEDAFRLANKIAQEIELCRQQVTLLVKE